MHEPHGHPRVLSAITSGEDQHHYRQNTSGQHTAQGTTVPSAWHGSNTTEHYALFAPIATQSVSVDAFRIRDSTRRGNDYGGKTALGGEFLESGQIATL
jgi:hypothetical protein